MFTIFNRNSDMIEINWGRPLSLIVSPQGDIQTFSTIEQALYWLRRKWPVADAAQSRAIVQVEAAMHCLTSVGTARRAFLAAARSAGFMPQIQAGAVAA